MSFKKTSRYYLRRFRRRGYIIVPVLLAVVLSLVFLSKPGRQLVFGGSNTVDTSTVAELGTSLEARSRVSQSVEGESSEPSHPDVGRALTGTSENPLQPNSDVPALSSPVGYEVLFSTEQRCIAGKQIAFGSLLFKIINGENNFTNGTLKYKIELLSTSVSLDGYETTKSFSTEISAPQYYYSNSEELAEDFTHAFEYPVVPAGASLSLKLTTQSLYSATRTVALQNVCEP